MIDLNDEPVITRQQFADMAWDALVRLTLRDMAEADAREQAEAQTQEAAA